LKNTRLRRLAAALAVATACTAGAGLTIGIQPAADTAWGAPASDDTGENTGDDTAWGTPPTDEPEPEPSEPTDAPRDTAWG
jgi:hypothetical protein